jgi:tyrosyl-tRNA synthetase
LTPQLIKPAITRELNALLAPIQEAFQASKEWQEIAEKAYPPPPKKEKKVKNKGTRYPGAAKDQQQKQEQQQPAAQEGEGKELPIRENGEALN